MLNGVKTTKKISPIIIGAMTLPNNSPILIHKLLSGINNFEFNIPKIKKDIERIIDQILTFNPSSTGQIPIKRKTKKNNIPKLFSEDFFIFLIYLR